MRPLRPWSFAQESGQAVVLVALAMSGLLLATGLAIDTGQLFVARRDQQAATDAAAWAGAVVIFKDGTGSAAVSAARTDATANGYTDGVASTTVTVASPPTTGEFSGEGNYVEVTITRTIRTTFLQGAGAGLTTVRTRAVGGATPAGSGHAILTLGDVPQGFKVSGNGDIAVSGGGIQVNSSHSTQAAQISGNSEVSVAAPYTAKIVGGVQESGSGGFVPAAQTGATPVADPFAALQEPSVTGLPVYTNTQISSDDPVTLSPGVYDNGIKISGNGTVTLQPGTYILRNGGFQLSGNGSLIGAGVTLFNTVADHPDTTGSCDKVQISGNGSVTLSAPTSGTYEGMLVWQDEDCDKDIQWSGNGELTSSSGTIYAPEAAFKISGNGTAALAVSSQIVTNSVEVSGNAEIVLNYDSDLNATPFVPALVS